MKNLFGFVLLLAISLSSFTSICAQGPDEYWIGLEEYAVHTTGDLEGMTTWRMYLHLLHEDDFLSACTGSDINPFILESTSTPAWYQHPEGSETFATGINSAFFTAFPNLEYDSWFTIGVEDNSVDMDILALADPTYDAFAAFESGENVYSDTQVGNGWATLFPGLGGLGIIDENCECVEVEASCLLGLNLNDLSDYFNAECANTDNPDALLYCALNETLLDAEFNGDDDACAEITTWIEENDWDGSWYGNELDCPILEMDLGDSCQAQGGLGIVDENCDCVEVEASCLLGLNLNDLSDYFNAECANTDNPDALLYCALNETLLDAEFNGDDDACAEITTWIEENDWDGSWYGNELDCPILEMDLGDPCQDLSIPTQNLGFAGDELRILMAQITTAGSLSGTIYVQIFPWGIQSPDLRLLLPILYAPIQCMDENACNYDASAWTNDECEYGPSAGVIEGDQDIIITGGPSEWSYSCSDEAASYEWSIIGGTILSGQGTSFVTVQWTTDGEISVTAISADGCPGIASTLEIDVLMGVENLTTSDDLDVFPSPASSNITISLDGIERNNRCQIYSLTGKKVLEFVLENNTQTLDVSSLTNSTYILTVHTEQGLVSQTFVISK